MKFHLFMLPTIGRRHELEQGMAGLRADLYQRMLSEIDEQARFADELGYYGMGFTEHHFHVEEFELSTNPIMLDAFVAMRTQNLKVGQLALVLPTHHPRRHPDHRQSPRRRRRLCRHRPQRLGYAQRSGHRRGPGRANRHG